MNSYRIKLVGRFGNVLHTWVQASTLEAAKRAAEVLYLDTEWRMAG